MHQFLSPLPRLPYVPLNELVAILGEALLKFFVNGDSFIRPVQPLEREAFARAAAYEDVRRVDASILTGFLLVRDPGAHDWTSDIPSRIPPGRALSMQSVITLVQALVWPVVLVALLFYFGRPLKRLLEQAAELSLKAGGVEAKLTRSSVEAAAQAAAALGAAATKQASDKRPEALSIETDVGQIAVSVTNAVTARETGRLSRTKILWADDRPTNNIFEQNALTSLGFDIETALSTEEALAKTRRQRYDIIISDMARPGDDRAGYTLLRELRSAGIEVPFIIYAGSNAPEHRAEARRNGAFGSTNNAGELIQLVTHAAQRDPR